MATARRKKENANGYSISVDYIGTEADCIRRQVERKPFVETEEKNRKVKVDFCLGNSFEEAAEVCRQLIAVNDRYSQPETKAE